eukprot:s10494_g1.t1
MAGASQLWRREVNAAADELCRQTADRAVETLPPLGLGEADDLVREVTSFLQYRATVLLSAKERPPWDHTPDGATRKRKSIGGKPKQASSANTAPPQTEA